MSYANIANKPAKDFPYFTPEQAPASGTAHDPQPSGRVIPKLFTPLKIRGIEFQNRIFLSPLCQYSAQDGHVTPWHLAHLGGILTRGPGLSIIEASAVLQEGRITPQDVGIWDDSHIDGLSQIVTFAHSQNQKIGIQLAHAGRKASMVAPWLDSGYLATKEVGGWPDNVYGPSAIKFDANFPEPKEASIDYIKSVVQAFVSAARRAVKAGFDVIEIHNAHGYLLHQFFSPVTNKRTDSYGGNFDNRTRLTIDVVDAVRAVIPEDMPLFLRISATDWLEKSLPEEASWTLDDTVRLAPILVKHGVDFIDVSSGGAHPQQKIEKGEEPAYQAFLANAVKKVVKGKAYVGSVGGITSGQIAQAILEREDADVAIVGRHFQKNPGAVWQFADDLSVSIHVAHQIEWGFAGRGKQSKSQT